MNIDKYDAFAGYNPRELKQTAKSYADIMDDYLKEYRKVGIHVKRYCDIDKFIDDYQMKVEKNEWEAKKKRQKEICPFCEEWVDLFLEILTKCGRAFFLFASRERQLFL